MTYRTVPLGGVDAIQDDNEPIHFYALDDGLAVFEKENVSIVPVEAYFQNSCQPLESNNIDWRNVRFKVKTLADNATTDYKIISQLWGGLPDGSEQLVAEWVDPIIDTTEVIKEVLFDLNNSSNLPELAHQNTDGATSGKCYLNLPLRWKNYDTIELRPSWADGYSYCKVVWLQGSNVGVKVGQNIVVRVSVTYDSGMKTDFSDIRFIDSDGKTYLCHERVSYTTSTSAVFDVYIPNIPGYPEVTPILMFYGNSGAGTGSNPFAIQFYDDFEDGLLTGRGSPYVDWTSPSSTFTITTTNPLGGVYSAKLTGNNNYASCFSYLPLDEYRSNSYVVEFDVKVISQGTGTYAPMFALFAKQDSNNYLRCYSYYDSGSGKQRIRAQEYYGGSPTEIGSADHKTGKLTLNQKYTFRITNTGSSIKAEIDGVTYFDSSYSPSIAPTQIGFTAWYNEVFVFDNIRIRPYKAQIPTILGTSSAYSNTPISPDGTPGDEDQQLIFTHPSGTYPIPYYVYVDELGVEGVRTNNVLLHNKGNYRLGADGIDKYVSLKLKNYITADSSCNIEFSDFQYEYEVFE